MTSPYRDLIQTRTAAEPDLRYLENFLNDNRNANSVCDNRATLARTAVLLDRTGGKWTRRPRNLDCRTWGPVAGADGQAILLDFLDTKTVEYLCSEFDLDPRVIQAHLAGCEQHYTGDWTKSEFTVAPCLRSIRRNSRFISVDFRRPYSVLDANSLKAFDHARKQTCSLLRSHHLLEGADVLFEHERYTIVWCPEIEKGRPGAVICLCDPIINVHNSASSAQSLLEASVAAIYALEADQPFNGSILSALCNSIMNIAKLWNEVAFYMDLQISALEDQVEHDFWDKPQNPVSILHRLQRASRRLTIYHGQLGSMKKDLDYRTESVSTSKMPAEKRAARKCNREEMLSDILDSQEKIRVLLQRADKAIPALLASIAINEGVKASSLTATALWFAPLSLSISLVSIDGSTRFGGKKYWIMVCIAVPLLLLVMAIANTSDKLMAALGKRRPGRALISLFKPETRFR